MGLQTNISVPDELPPWSRVASWLGEHGLLPMLRMIDGLPAFPDEEPPDDWRELRLGTPAGMVTLRREPGRLHVITWGNADADTRQSAQVLAQLLAELTGGQVLLDD